MPQCRTVIFHSSDEITVHTSNFAKAFVRLQVRVTWIIRRGKKLNYLPCGNLLAQNSPALMPIIRAAMTDGIPINFALILLPDSNRIDSTMLQYRRICEALLKYRTNTRLAPEQKWANMYDLPNTESSSATETGLSHLLLLPAPIGVEIESLSVALCTWLARFALVSTVDTGFSDSIWRVRLAFLTTDIFAALILSFLMDVISFSFS